MALDLHHIRSLFPVLHQEVNGKPLVYLDNAATTQKPQSVMDSLTRYYELDNANIHRGAHTLAARATEYYEKTRLMVQEFINSREPEEVIFTKGTTEGINLVASTFGRKFIHKGDEIIISTLEHHSNIVPWQMLCEESGAVLKIIPINDKGEIKFRLVGRGWGHGVGLCQIGAAIMAERGYSYIDILKHYYKGVKLEKIY